MRDAEWATDLEALARLRAKYLSLIDLRERRTAAPSEPPPRAELRELAAHFPGALRELELRPLPELRARAAALSPEALTVEVPRWAVVQVCFHGLLRDALALKAAMAVAGRSGGDPLQAARHLQAGGRVGPGAPEPGFWTLERLTAIQRPLGGRLSPLVIGWVSSVLCITEKEVNMAVFPTSHSCPL